MNRCLRCDGILQGGDFVIPVEQVNTWSNADVVTTIPAPRRFVHVWCASAPQGTI